MKKNRIVVIGLSGIMIAAGAIGAAACSDSTSGTGIPTTGVDATAKVDGGGAPDEDTGTTPVGDGSVSDSPSGTPDCGKVPILHPPVADGGMFCPFSRVDGGKDIYCANGDQCCSYAKGGPTATCLSKGTACPTSTFELTAYECMDPSDCPTAQKCCAQGVGDAGVSVGTSTCGPFITSAKFGGTRCATSCAPNELVVCTSQSECTTGTCTAVHPKGSDLGVCK